MAKTRKSIVPNDVMTIDEVADYLDVSTSTIYKRVSLREIPYAKIGGGLRFTRKSIDAWLARNTVQPDDSLFDEFARLQNRYHFQKWLEGRGIDWRTLTEEEYLEQARQALEDLRQQPGKKDL